MEVYARELITALVEAAPPEVSFIAFASREAAAVEGPWGELIPMRTVPVKARHRPQWVLGEQLPLPAMAHRAKVDVVHSLASTAPLWGPFRRVTTVHDLIYARCPETHAGARELGMRLLVPAAVRRSHRVMTGSLSTRRDLVELLGVDPSRIDVVPHGLGTVRRQPPLAEAETRKRFDLGVRKIVLSLSAKRPHKNLERLIGALARIPAERRPLLVVPGYPTPYEDQLRHRAAVLGVTGDVRLPGWLSGSELEGLWAISDAFVFPSLYEGFGLPVLEAMARGVPVACSDASSLPEVAGDAAILFDPGDEGAIASAIERLLGDTDEAEGLRRRGLMRAAQFTWRRAAHSTLEAYARVMPTDSGAGAQARGRGYHDGS
jgi:glycosyltransferase involved in cell wall biosynthesis